MVQSNFARWPLFLDVLEMGRGLIEGINCWFLFGIAMRKVGPDCAVVFLFILPPWWLDPFPLGGRRYQLPPSRYQVLIVFVLELFDCKKVLNAFCNFKQFIVTFESDAGFFELVHFSPKLVLPLFYFVLLLLGVKTYHVFENFLVWNTEIFPLFVDTVV